MLPPPHVCRQVPREQNPLGHSSELTHAAPTSPGIGLHVTGEAVVSEDPSEVEVPPVVAGFSEVMVKPSEVVGGPPESLWLSVEGSGPVGDPVEPVGLPEVLEVSEGVGAQATSRRARRVLRMSQATFPKGSLSVDRLPWPFVEPLLVLGADARTLWPASGFALQHPQTPKK